MLCLSQLAFPNLLGRFVAFTTGKRPDFDEIKPVQAVLRDTSLKLLGYEDRDGKLLTAEYGVALPLIVIRREILGRLCGLLSRVDRQLAMFRNESLRFCKYVVCVIGSCIRLNRQQFAVRFEKIPKCFDGSLTERRVSRDRWRIVLSLNGPDGDMWLPQMGQRNRFPVQPLNVPSAEIVVKRIQPDERWGLVKIERRKPRVIVVSCELVNVHGMTDSWWWFL